MTGAEAATLLKPLFDTLWEMSSHYTLWALYALLGDDADPEDIAQLPWHTPEPAFDALRVREIVANEQRELAWAIRHGIWGHPLSAEDVASSHAAIGALDWLLLHRKDEDINAWTAKHQTQGHG